MSNESSLVEEGEPIVPIRSELVINCSMFILSSLIFTSHKKGNILLVMDDFGFP